MKIHYTNDVTAPRMRKGKFSKSVVTKDLFKKFKKEFPEYSELEWKTFIKIWLDIAKEIRKQSIYNQLGVKLGSYCGELKLQYLPYNFKTTLPDGTNHLNLNTRSKVAKIKWERRWAVKFNKSLQYYAFEGTRDLNKLAKNRVTENPEKLRTARNTLGGKSIWRTKMKNNEH